MSNCIEALAKHEIVLDETIINYAYDASLDYQLRDLLKLDVQEQIVLHAKQEMISHM